MKIILVLCLMALYVSCANYQLHLPKDYEPGILQESDSGLLHTVYLIGDGGDAQLNETNHILPFLKTQLSTADSNSSIIFLGDNIYPKGMPKKTSPDRELAEHKLNVQLNALDSFQGNIIFIPGNHDYGYGIDGLKRQQKYIEKYLNQKRNQVDSDDSEEWEQYFYPRNACGEPFLYKAEENLTFLLLDSEWWFHNWNEETEMNDGCTIKTRDAFLKEFEDIVKKYRNKNLLIASHHPFWSNGMHGGYFTFDQHLFPLRTLNKSLYIPLPVLGSIFQIIRATAGLPQDIAHPEYQDYINGLLPALTKNGRYIIASGHEHGLQYIEKENQVQIISGSGSKANPTSRTTGKDFSYGQYGFSKLLYYEDGRVEVAFYSLNKELTELNLVYKTQVKGAQDWLSYDTLQDTFSFDWELDHVNSKPTTFDFKKPGGIRKAVLGEHYSSLYLNEYEFETLDLATFSGGVTPIKRGGGNQTNSLRLEDSAGRQFTMRSLTKDPSRTLPFPINQIKGAEYLLRDNFMAAHPFAALVVADLAKAVNVFHTNPKLYYVPKQPTLDYHNEVFGDQVYLVEERAGGNWKELKSFGYPDKIISTYDLIEKLHKNGKHRVDQAQVLRSRLLDLIVKDWDRHQDQWKWAVTEDSLGKVYRPIPRDRDQAFAKYDGLVAGALRLVDPFMKQLQTYKGHERDIRWFSWNARFIDKVFINELDWKHWEKEINDVQKNLTDDIIKKAFQTCLKRQEMKNGRI